MAAIWLSPPYPSPNADFGYDVSDYMRIDPAYGSLEGFDRLVSAAHGRGLKVVLDFVPAHLPGDWELGQIVNGRHSKPEDPWGPIPGMVACGAILSACRSPSIGGIARRVCRRAVLLR